MRRIDRWKILPLTILLSAGVLIAARPATTSVSKKQSPLWQMDPDNVNQIRQSLLMPSDEEAELRFTHDVLRRYATATSRPWEDFHEEPHIQQAMEILHDPDPSFGHDVRVLSDPPVIAEFKASVLPMIVKGCGSNGCHGNAGVGNFYLSYRLGNTAEVYADFNELRQYVKTVENNKKSMFAAPLQYWMIDTVDPEKSLLVQYALPAALAHETHPHVRDWHAMVMDKTDSRYQKLIRWINELKQ